MTSDEPEKEKYYPVPLVRDFVRFYGIFIEHNEARVYTHKSFEQAFDDAMEEYRQTYGD